MITVETIREIEQSVNEFSTRLDFCRHVRKIIDAAYDGVKMTDHGGLMRSDAAVEIDEKIESVMADAGYVECSDSNELAQAIWAKK